MSVSVALQKLIFARLISAGPVVALIGQRVYDAPVNPVNWPYVTFGPSDYLPDDYDCIDGRIEVQQLDVWSKALDGKAECKRICDAIKAALHDFMAEPEVGALVSLRVILVRVMDDPEPGIFHGIVTVEANIEEAGAS